MFVSSGNYFRSSSRVFSVCVLLAINLFVFRDHWRGTTSFPFDFPQSYYANTAYWIASVQSGEWPHWIPYQSFGYPAVLNMQLGLFYPPFWLFVLFQQPFTLHAANVVQVLHVLFGAIGFLLFARRCFCHPVALCGAACFQLFGGFYSNAEHTDIVRAYAWIPWVLWALLLDEAPNESSWRGKTFQTRLSTPNVLLPLIAACFITGAYPGLVVSVFLIMGVFIVTQVGALYLQHRDPQTFRDGAIQCVLLAVGMGMAAVYLLPTAYLINDLARAHNAATYSPWFVEAADLYQFFLPGNLLPRDDYSMHGMQLPLLLLLFLPLARIRAGLLAPILATGLTALTMCFSGLSFVSNGIVRLFPVLRLSRFPAGDYRIFISLAVLICGLAGLDRLVVERRRAAQIVGILFAGLVVFLCWSASAFSLGLTAEAKDGLIFTIGFQAVLCTAVIAAWPIFFNRGWSRHIWVHMVTIGCALGLWPTLAQMKPFWNDPKVEQYLYDRQGLSLIGKDGRLRVFSIFERTEEQRPARELERPVERGQPSLVFRGYIEGSYWAWDEAAGGRSTGLQAVYRNPALLKHMLRPGEIVRVNCESAEFCSGRNITEVNLEGQPPAGKSVLYARNTVVYDIDVRSRSLVVENEMESPGWTGVCETHGEVLVPQRVHGALRGWILEAGKHRLRLDYRTPLLFTGAVVSGFFLAAWAAVLGAWLIFRGERLRMCGYVP